MNNDAVQTIVLLYSIVSLSGMVAIIVLLMRRRR